MKLQGQYTIDAPRANVWSVLQDRALLARILPVFQQIETLGNGRYKGAINIQLGPVQGDLAGSVVLTDVTAPESCILAFDSKGTLGFLKGSGTLTLLEQESTTVVQYSGAISAGGRLASFGARMVEATVKGAIVQMLETIAPYAQAYAQTAPSPAPETLSTEPVDLAAAAEPAPVYAPAVQSQTSFAFGVARHVLAEIVPAHQRLPLVLIGVVVLLIIAVEIFRG